MNHSLTPTQTGRRDRNMQDKRKRIFDAAETLFEEQGFEAVTTSAISERADIGAGTLFRYAASKTELLLLVYNSKLATALRQGAAQADRAGDLVDAITAMVAPLVELGRTSGGNGAIYQRELLFGPPTQTHRKEGLALIVDLEAAIAGRLLDQAVGNRLHEARDGARLASSSIFAVTHLAASRSSTGAHAEHDPMEDLRGQIRQIVSGYFSVLARAEPAQKATKDNSPR